MVTLVLSIILVANFDRETAGFQFVHEIEWLAEIGMGYRLGVDGISVLFVLLTAGLMPLCIMASGAIEKRVADYMIAFLLLETLVIGVFCALDLVVFYIFFEGGLIPMFIIIGVWGGQNRVYAAFKFFLYTLLGSVLMLVAMVYMFLQSGTTDITALLDYEFARNAPDVDVAGLLRLLRSEDADVAGAHLAAGRPRAGPDGGARSSWRACC